MRQSTFAAVVLFGFLLLIPAWGCGGGTTTPSADPPFVSLMDFQAAAVVIGQPDFTSNMENQGGAVGANTTGRPGSVADGSLYVADITNNRVLGFLAPPTMSNQPADFVLGQSDLMSNAAGTSATQLSSPAHPRIFGGKFFLIDVGNHRVLIWNAPPTSNTAADVVVGQPDFVTGTSGMGDSKFSQPAGITVASGRLIVSDDLNNRVLIWNTVPTMPGVPADVVIGQPDFMSNMQNQGMADPAANTLARPGGIWSDGTRLVVADATNERVLIWNSIPVANNAPADIVLGQADFTSDVGAAGAAGMDTPSDVDSNGTQLFVADLSNNRILVWNTFPTASSTPADVVLGQSNFTNTAPNDDDQDGAEDATPSARTIRPMGFFLYVRVLGNRVFVGDHFNHRVLVFDGN